MLPKISAVLCTFNEDIWLEECLKSLQWCDEIIVCDMGSLDNTLSIAKKYTPNVINIKRVPYVELIRALAVSHSQYDWIVYTDPDFIFPSQYANELKRKIAEQPSLSCINMYYHNYFKEHEILHGKWKPSQTYPILFNKNKMELPPILHNGFKLIEGDTFTPEKPIVLKHMWMNSEEHFYQKHRRYIANEGVRKIIKHEVPSSHRLLNSIIKSLRRFLFGGIVEGKMGWNLTQKDIWYEYQSAKRHRLDLITFNNIYPQVEKDREIIVYFNYYIDKDPHRAEEINYCLHRLANNPYINKLIIITNDATPLLTDNMRIINLQANRPSFADIFSVIKENSSDDSINIYINSDCFISEKSTLKLLDMNKNEAYCLGRYEIPKISPLLPWKLQKKVEKSPHGDMQDCWIFCGIPKETMWLDFYPGTPGCDNRIAYEFNNAGYKVTNPLSSIKILHNHSTQLRRYTEKERVPEPYFFPERI